MPNNLEITMDTTKQREARKQRYTRRLAQDSLRRAGTPTHVGAAIGRSQSTVSHCTTDKVHPDLERAFTVLLNLSQYPGVSGRAYAEDAAEAVDLNEIVLEEDAILIERGIFLVDEVNRRDAIADSASLGEDEGWWSALRRLSSASGELPSIAEELALRGFNLRQLYRERKAAQA